MIFTLLYLHFICPDIGKVSNVDTGLTTTTPPTSVSGNSTSNETDDTGGSTKAANCALDVYEVCPENVECALLGGECIDCDFNTSCQYGRKQKVKCSPKVNVTCLVSG